MSIAASNKIVTPSYQTAFNTSLTDKYFVYNLNINQTMSQVWPFNPVNLIVDDIGTLIDDSGIVMISLGGDFKVNQGVTTRAKSIELNFAAACAAGGETFDFNIWFLRTAVAKSRNDLLDVECFKFSSGLGTLPASVPAANTIIQEFYVGQNGSPGNISAFACSLTNVVTSYGQFMENQYGSIGADVWTPGGSGVAKIIIPECFGSSLALVEVRPSGGSSLIINTDNPVLVYASVEY